MKLDEILESINLAEGDSTRMNCPVCGGYNTFSISKLQGKLIWNCYKASCSCSGKTSACMSISDIKEHLFSVPGRAVTPVQTFDMPNHVVQMKSPALDIYAESYGLTKSLWFDVKETRAVFPIYDRNGLKLLGAVGRSLIPSAYERMKWRRYDKQKDLMYFSDSRLDVAVLVEDCVSAEACFNAGFTGIALLGTTLHESRIKDLMDYTQIIIALDKDASLKSLKIKKMLEVYTNCRVVFLLDDLKYFSPSVVQTILSTPVLFSPSL